jgi:hypothetical protein
MTDNSGTAIGTGSVPSADAMSPPVGASVWEREMFDHLTTHGRREGAMLEEYARAASATGSKALAYVVGLLIDDERRHHQHFAELAASLKSEAELAPEGPAIPRLDFHRVERDDVLEVTRRLLAEERADLAALKLLRRQLRDVEDTTLWALLVDMMQRDTEKHVAILEFVETHTKPSGVASGRHAVR